MIEVRSEGRPVGAEARGVRRRRPPRRTSERRTVRAFCVGLSMIAFWGGSSITHLELPILSPVPLEAQERSLEMESFHADIQVHPSGDLEVTEFLELRFSGQWNGVYRWIPVEYRTQYGANYTLRLDMESIRDQAGVELRYDSERRGRNRVFQIWVPGANDATRTVVLHYRVENGLRFFDEHDELYWNVTGTETEFPIRSASATVMLPAGVDGLRHTAFTGPSGAVEENATATVTDNRIDFETTESLDFREGLTIVVGWNPGVVHRPTALDRALGFLISNMPLLIPILTAIGMFLLWRRVGKDPELRALTVEYEPPDGLIPAEAGTVIDASPDMRDITASIVDLAVRGFLEIEERDEKAFFGLVSDRRFIFRLREPGERRIGLHPFERKLIDAMFGSKNEVSTEELENAFYKELPGLQSALKASLVDGGHYLHQPDSVRAMYVVGGILAGAIVGFVGAAVVAGMLGQQPYSAIVAGVLTGAVIIGFGLVMPARTQGGTRVLERLRGFEEFLRRVETDRFERMIKTPELFEKYLPYAMAFGVENNWARAFDDIYRSPPDWYRSSSMDGFMAHSLVHNLSGMTRATQTAMTTAPRSHSSGGSSGFAGSSGFGGGGFSGGGFGGGGTGGF